MPVIAVLLLNIGAAAPKKVVFTGLKVGQQVGLKDHGAAFEISVLSEEVPQVHKIIEMGDDFVILEDVGAVTQTTIPAYSLKAVVRMAMFWSCHTVRRNRVGFFCLGKRVVEAVIFIGLQASGKSSFFKERFFSTHVRITPLRLARLRLLVPDSNVVDVALDHDESAVSSCLRWMLRGLPIDKAIRKVRTDLEIAEQARLSNLSGNLSSKVHFEDHYNEL